MILATAVCIDLDDGSRPDLFRFFAREDILSYRADACTNGMLNSLIRYPKPTHQILYQSQNLTPIPKALQLEALCLPAPKSRAPVSQVYQLWLAESKRKNQNRRPVFQRAGCRNGASFH